MAPLTDMVKLSVFFSFSPQEGQVESNVLTALQHNLRTTVQV